MEQETSEQSIDIEILEEVSEKDNKIHTDSYNKIHSIEKIDNNLNTDKDIFPFKYAELPAQIDLPVKKKEKSD